MQLVEVMVSAMVFSLGAATGLQLMAIGGESQQRLGSRSQLLAQIEQDRLQLQARWRAMAQAPAGECGISRLQLETAAAAVSLEAPLRRQLSISADGQSLEVSWHREKDLQPWRRRLFSGAGLGLCSDSSGTGRTP